MRAVCRIIALVLGNLISFPIVSALSLFPGSSRSRFLIWYFRISARIIGMRVRLIGVPGASGRPVIFVSNHTSWLDIPALGSVLTASFVAKAGVAKWPVIGTMAKLFRSVFVSRQKSTLAQESGEIRARLDAGDSLILFPEATSSDGARVLPFRSSFFALATSPNPPLFQPVSVVYDQLAGLPANRSTRPVFAWYGDMRLPPHFWHLVRQPSFRCTILLHPPLDPANFAGRKDLALAAHRAVAEGAALLRQNRPIDAIQSADPALSPSYA